ncbi:MAG: undecaprenyl-diphosphate phosphatase [Synergistaceae bacterium]|nr:undecaprenyl-diphosphate phosphatase [Synergistaceae bacterium]
MTITIFQSIVLGIVQGLTEFLPVSSSAHLAFFQALFGQTENMLGYDIVLHMATLFAVLLYFIKDIITLVTEWLRGFSKRESREKQGWSYGWAILCGTAVTALIALPLKKIVEEAMNSPVIVAIGLFFTSLLLWYIENIKSRERKISLSSGLLVGLIQGIAVMPGISRSGSTIFMGRLAGLPAGEAFRFSFLLSVPAIAGATLLEILAMFKAGEVTLPSYWWLGAFLAFSLGLLSLVLLRRFVVGGRWRLFSVYCAFLAFVMISLHVLG